VFQKVGLKTMKAAAAVGVRQVSDWSSHISELVSRRGGYVSRT
jgi:hypothetical protein